MNVECRTVILPKGWQSSFINDNPTPAHTTLATRVHTLRDPSINVTRHLAPFAPQSRQKGICLACPQPFASLSFSLELESVARLRPLGRRREGGGAADMVQGHLIQRRRP